MLTNINNEIVDFGNFYLSPMNKENNPEDFLFLRENRYTKFLNTIISSPFTIEDAKNWCNAKNKQTFCYYNIYSKKNKEIAGFIYFINFFNAPSKVVAIKSKYENQGWIRKSTFFIFRLFYEKNIKILNSFVHIDNINAQNHLESEGWTLKGEKSLPAIDNKNNLIPHKHYEIKLTVDKLVEPYYHLISPINKEIKHDKFETLKPYIFFKDYTLTILLIIGTLYTNRLTNNTIYPLFTLINSFLFIRLFNFCHEAVHNKIVKSSTINNLIGKYLTAFPIFLSYTYYKTTHLTHHKYLFSDLDGDKFTYINFPKGKTYFFNIYKILKEVFYNQASLSDIVLIFQKLFRIGNFKRNFSKDFLEFSIYWIIVLTFIVLLKLVSEFILLWCIPFILMLIWLNLSVILQHGFDPKLKIFYTKNVKNSFLSLLILPINDNYHYEHHLFPKVPYYNLPSMKEEFKKRNFYKRQTGFKNLSPIEALKTIYM